METLLHCVMDIGEQMLCSGAEVHRVEESIRRMCGALGAVRVDVFIITSSMVVTVFTDEEHAFTQTRRITTSTTDFEKLHHLNALSREICSRPLTAVEIRARLTRIAEGRVYPLWSECVAYASIAGAFTLFFGGDVAQMAVSLVVGLSVRLGILLLDRVISNKIFAKFFSAVLATALAFAAVRLGCITDVDKVIIGNIMTLIPGIGMTNALRDLFTGDSIAGLLRSIEAVLTACAIAAGYFLVAALGGLTL